MLSIKELPNNIFKLFTKEHKVNEKNLKEFQEAVGQCVKEALADKGVNEKPSLRMSLIGTPARKLWYTFKYYDTVKPIKPQMLLNFLYGHMLEHLVVLLSKEAGYIVTDQQKTVEIDGVPGHLDGKWNGKLCDVKSATSYGFDKFARGTLFHDDAYGYLEQISAYAEAEGVDDAYFICINKQTGDICVLHVNSVDLRNAKKRIEELKEALSKDTPPPRCYSDVPHGIKGNRKLGPQCAILCPFKYTCWPNLRVFEYSNGPVYMTKVVDEPRVKEITKNTKSSRSS